MSITFMKMKKERFTLLLIMVFVLFISIKCVSAQSIPDISTDISTDTSITPTPDISTDTSTTPTQTDISTDTSTTPTPTDISTDTSTTPTPTDISTDTSTTPTDISTDTSTTPTPTDISTDTSITPTPDISTTSTPTPTDVSTDTSTTPDSTKSTTASMSSKNTTDSTTSYSIPTETTTTASFSCHSCKVDTSVNTSVTGECFTTTEPDPQSESGSIHSTTTFYTTTTIIYPGYTTTYMITTNGIATPTEEYIPPSTQIIVRKVTAEAVVEIVGDATATSTLSSNAGNSINNIWKDNLNLECSIEYVDGKPLYNIQFGENMEYNVCSTNSSTGAGNKYITALLMLEKNKTLTEEDIKKINKDVTTSSKISARQVYDEVEQNKENLFYLKDNIRIKQVRFEINEKNYDINYGKFDKDNDTKLKHAVVKSLDRGRVSRDAYRSLADINQHLPYYIGKGGQRRITDILNYIVPKYIEQGRKVKHVMITVALLNDIERLRKPESHHTLVLYPGSEKLYFSSDWKFLATCLGINAANSNYFCSWCLCNKNDEGKLDSNGKLIGNWTITKNISNIKQNFLQIQGHIHRLFELFLSDLKRNGELGQIIQQQIIMEMKRLKINFQFWSEKNSNKLSYISMMDPDKLKVLHEFNFASINVNYLSKEKQQQLQKLWNGFDELFNLLHRKNITESYFQQKAIQWLEYFLIPSKGHPYQNFIRGLYRPTDCTPYMHVLVYHVPEFLNLHQDL
ncbi:3271_t:CDS:10, partial [Diversispora eburnea]